ncbi:MAG: hypothetical protein ACKVOH_00870 [Chlamydiales bacterium]
MKNQPFFGKEIDPDLEQRYIKKVLHKYRLEIPSEELKKKIYNDLSDLKAVGKISIPFSVIFRSDDPSKHRPFVEVILDTKV